MIKKKDEQGECGERMKYDSDRKEDERKRLEEREKVRVENE